MLQCTSLRASINYEERNFSLHRLVQSVTREKQRVAFVRFVRMRQDSHLDGKGVAVFISNICVHYHVLHSSKFLRIIDVAYLCSLFLY